MRDDRHADLDRRVRPGVLRATPDAMRLRYTLRATSSRSIGRHGASWALWTYKDIGLQGVVYADPTGPWMELLRPALAKKARLATDSWGGQDAQIRHVMDPIAATMAAEFPEGDPMVPMGWKWTAERLVRAVLFGEALLPEFAERFRGLSDADLEALAASFALRNCVRREGLIDVLGADQQLSGDAPYATDARRRVVAAGGPSSRMRTRHGPKRKKARRVAGCFATFLETRADLHRDDDCESKKQRGNADIERAAPANGADALARAGQLPRDKQSNQKESRDDAEGRSRADHRVVVTVVVVTVVTILRSLPHVPWQYAHNRSRRRQSQEITFRTMYSAMVCGRSCEAEQAAESPGEVDGNRRCEAGHRGSDTL